MTPLALIQFSRDEVGEARWFADDPALDAQISQRFEPPWQRARAGALDVWQKTPEGALALVILLDQFPRNIFRGRADAFSTDSAARTFADRAIADEFDRRVPTSLRPFFYLPFMHAEDLASQDRSVALFADRIGTDSQLSLRVASPR
jgi:uncharacterized protein (DUF924 family)